jgi:alpha-glucosidase
VTGQPGVRPAERPWFEGAVSYQIYPRSFLDSNGDGTGDLVGITAKLSYVAELGVDAIWLSPIFRSPMVDNGYDISDHCDVDPLFGTLAEASALIDEAHRLGLKVILDMIPNHVSDQHRWFQEALSSPDSPYRQWFVFAPRSETDPSKPPNDWRRITEITRAGSAWTWSGAADAWYLGTFAAVQPDLDWHHAPVREAMYDIVEFWMDRGVDGFRLDMLDFIGKDPDLRDEGDEVGNAPDYISATRYHSKTDFTFEYCAELSRRIHARGGIVIGEVGYYLTSAQIRRYYTSGLDLPFRFALIDLPFEASAWRTVIGDLLDDMPLDAQAAFTLANHDRPRISRFGPQGMRVALTVLLTLPGHPFVYYGDELGMDNVEVPEHLRRDPFVVETGLGRDQSRTPMPWTPTAPHAGFTTADAPWLPLGADIATANVESQTGDRGSMLELQRALLQLRQAEPSLRYGSLHWIDTLGPEVLAFSRMFEEPNANDGQTSSPQDSRSTVTVIANFGSEPVDITTVISSVNGDSSLAIWTDPAPSASPVPTDKTPTVVHGRTAIVVKSCS